MRVLTNLKAVSTFILIILILCSIVLGAFISYLLVMSSYYNMPENTTLIIVEDVVFPIFDAGYFNVTILNPSNSVSDVNITAIRLSVKGRNESYDITTTEPVLGTIKRGTKLAFKCKKNWSNFTGEPVRIEPIAENALTTGYSCITPKVELILTPDFDVSQSVEYFDLTVENSEESIVNLTISEIMLFGMSINENVTPVLPYVVSPAQTEMFRCNWNWENLRGQNVTITVKTSEGYEKVYTTSKLSGANLYIQEITFDYTNSTCFNLKITSLEDSTATATIDRINLTLHDGMKVSINETSPILGIPSVLFSSIPPNESKTFKCSWNWTDYRNETITIDVYTLEGFATPNQTTTTPPVVVWNVTDVKFDLDRTGHFLMNVTNMPVSLRSITITGIEFNETDIGFESQIVQAGEEIPFNCTFDWKKFTGKNVTVTVITEDGLNISRIISISSVELKLLDMAISEADVSDLNITIPYINIIVANSNNSLQNVTITKILLESKNVTHQIDGSLTHPELVPDGYVLKVGKTVAIVCQWNWLQYLGGSIKVTVYTAEGFQVSRTWYPFTP